MQNIWEERFICSVFLTTLNQFFMRFFKCLPQSMFLISSIMTLDQVWTSLGASLTYLLISLCSRFFSTQQIVDLATRLIFVNHSFHLVTHIFNGSPRSIGYFTNLVPRYLKPLFHFCNSILKLPFKYFEMSINMYINLRGGLLKDVFTWNM